MGGMAMTWSLERVFYGSRQGLNFRSMWEFLMRGFYPIPYTLFNGYVWPPRRSKQEQMLKESQGY